MDSELLSSLRQPQDSDHLRSRVPLGYELDSPPPEPQPRAISYSSYTLECLPHQPQTASPLIRAVCKPPQQPLATCHEAGATSYESRPPAWVRQPTTQGTQTPNTPSLRSRAPLSRDPLQATSDRSYESRTHETPRAWRPASHTHTPSFRSRAPLARDQLKATSSRSYEPRTHELLRG